MNASYCSLHWNLIPSSPVSYIPIHNFAYIEPLRHKASNCTYGNIRSCHQDQLVLRHHRRQLLLARRHMFGRHWMISLELDWEVKWDIQHKWSRGITLKVTHLDIIIQTNVRIVDLGAVLVSVCINLQTPLRCASKFSIVLKTNFVGNERKTILLVPRNPTNPPPFFSRSKTPCTADHGADRTPPKIAVIAP